MTATNTGIHRSVFVSLASPSRRIGRVVLKSSWSSRPKAKRKAYA